MGSGDTMDGFAPYVHLFIGQDPLAIARHVRALETIDFHAGRYWPLEAYKVGTSPPSFDKQFVRDYCESLGWDKTYPGPDLPEDVVAGTRARYIEAFELLTGLGFDAYLAHPEVVLG